MRKIFGVLLAAVISMFFLIGTCAAEDNAVSISLNSPASSQAIAPGGNVEISGTAENVQQIALVVLNDDKDTIVYVAQPSVVNGSFSTGFQLNSDALEGSYTIRIGAEGLSTPMEFTFTVSKNSTSPTTGGSIGGSPGGGGGLGTAVPAEVVLTPSAEVPSFNDVADHWALGSINQLVARGAINGYPDGSFRPDNTITRAEFAAVLVKAFQLENHSDITFNDSSTHWARDYIAAAVGSGVANGYNGDTFGPDDPITREQMAVMIVRAAGLQPAVGGNTSFSDSGSISVWAREAIAAMTQGGFMKGYSNNTIQPLNNATRGEAATLIMNILNTRTE